MDPSSELNSLQNELEILRVQPSVRTIALISYKLQKIKYAFELRTLEGGQPYSCFKPLLKMAFFIPHPAFSSSWHLECFVVESVSIH